MKGGSDELFLINGRLTDAVMGARRYLRPKKGVLVSMGNFTSPDMIKDSIFWV